MLPSASSIQSAIITNLSAASALGAASVDRHYGILETAPQWAAVVSWTGLLDSPNAFGESSERSWTHSIELFVRDSSDPLETMDRVAQVIDKTINSLKSDWTLQDTVGTITAIRANRNVGIAFNVGGNTWLPINIEIDTYSV